MCVGLFSMRHLRSLYDEQAEEIRRLRASNQRLRQQLTRSTQQQAAAAAVEPRPRVLRARLAAAIEVHGVWNWNLLVHDLLQPFHTITERMLDAAVQTCFENGTMYCMRAQVVGGRLYITDYRAIFFDRHYAPARVLPLLETLRRHPNLPDLDIVVAANDEPRIPITVNGPSWTQTCRRWPGQVLGAGVSGRLPPPVFASTINRA